MTTVLLYHCLLSQIVVLANFIFFKGAPAAAVHDVIHRSQRQILDQMLFENMQYRSSLMITGYFHDKEVNERYCMKPKIRLTYFNYSNR